jgi:hypothetical protein
VIANRLSPTLDFGPLVRRSSLGEGGWALDSYQSQIGNPASGFSAKGGSGSNRQRRERKNMKQRVAINGSEYDDGGFERAEATLKDGNDVIVENFYFDRDAESFNALATRYAAKIHFTDGTCHLVLKPN